MKNIYSYLLEKILDHFYLILILFNFISIQEVPADKGRLVLKILHGFKHITSIFDDFVHYEKRQEEDEGKRQPPPQQQVRDQNLLPEPYKKTNKPYYLNFKLMSYKGM